LAEFAIRTMNVFEERVFDDTAVCSIQFSRKTEAETETETEPIRVHVYPSMSVELTPENNYTIGGEIYNLPRNDAYKVSRATRLAREHDSILLKCIDDSIDSQFRVADAAEVANTWIIRRTCPPEVMRSSA
jgi:hypothetical protein